jgi:hypothetical protein
MLNLISEVLAVVDISSEDLGIKGNDAGGGELDNVLKILELPTFRLTVT